MLVCIRLFSTSVQCPTHLIGWLCIIGVDLSVFTVLDTVCLSVCLETHCNSIVPFKQAYTHLRGRTHKKDQSHDFVSQTNQSELLCLTFLEKLLCNPCHAPWVRVRARVRVRVSARVRARVTNQPDLLSLTSLTAPLQSM